MYTKKRDVKDKNYFSLHARQKKVDQRAPSRVLISPCLSSTEPPCRTKITTVSGAATRQDEPVIFEALAAYSFVQLPSLVSTLRPVPVTVF